MRMKWSGELKNWVAWWGTQSNLMRLLVLQMTVNEMLKNPQHLWHFLDLLKSLKTPRKRFLAVEKDNHWKRTLLTFSLDFFSGLNKIWSNFLLLNTWLIPFEAGEGGWVGPIRQTMATSVSHFFSAFDFHAFCRQFPITGPGKGGIKERKRVFISCSSLSQDCVWIFWSRGPGLLFLRVCKS